MSHRSRCRWFPILLLPALIAVPARATMIHEISGLSSVGHPVSLRAELTITGDTLTVKLINCSETPSQAPNDLLTSYYFDIIGTNNSRPTLTYVSALGDVYLTDKSNADSEQASHNVKAVNPGDDSWQFLTMDDAWPPGLGFGIGTAGNNNLTPNNFNGNVVDGMDYGIYVGDVSTQSLANRMLVKNSVTFTFSGLTGFTEADIKPGFMFGLGTAPDSIVPEPTPLVLLSLASVILLHRRG